MPGNRKWYQFWKQDTEVVEENAAVNNSAVEPTHEYNMDIGNTYIRMLECTGDMPFTIQQIRAFTKNPLAHILEIRRMAHWAYHTNGVISTAIDYIKSMYTLDGVVV